MEYWSIGVLDVIQTEVDKPRSKRTKAVIIGSVDAIEQNKFSYVMANQLVHPNGSGNVFFQYSITPTLQYS